MSVEIIIDSSADIAEDLKDKVNVVSLSVFFGETEYKDGVTIDYKSFYEKLIETDVLPTTSQAPPSDFESAYEGVVSRGSEAVVLTVSSKLSGTYQSACIAASGYEGKIFVVDTQSVAIGAGILAKRAVQLKEQGFTASEICDTLEKEKSRTYRPFFC
jgi:DegV family protein with EDD domain